jgi:activator of HSP90 ATPase
MAKWGEGDARWIVEDRKDGANVNGWHWEEKNRMHWVKERVPELLQQLSAEAPGKRVIVRVKEVVKVDGHVRFSIA